MSGFEVAGVILGSLPLLINALQHYSEGLSTIKGMVQYEQAFRELHVVFEAAWTTYRASCERLLLPLAIADQEFRELIDNPASEKWRDEVLKRKLQLRLGASYVPYRNATEELHKKVEKLRKKLKLNDSYLPPWVTKIGNKRNINEAERIKFFKGKWARITGGFDLGSCARHVDRIMRDIELISTMVKDVVELEAPRKERQQQTDSTYWITVRDHARRLFKTLESKWSQPCSCQHWHRASLQLDLRGVEEENLSTGVRFRFALSFDKNTGGAAITPWDWRDVEIESHCLSKTGVDAQALSVPTVQFSTSTPIINITPAEPLKRPKSQPSFSGTKIIDFCRILNAPPTPMAALGYIEDQSWQHHVYRRKIYNGSPSTRKVISLKDTICNRTRGDISTKEKRVLALKMALAVLQLHGTPWLDSTWDTKDINFITDSTGSSISLFEPPYVSRSFIAQSAAQPSSRVQSNGRLLAKNALIFALGVALVELSYGEPLISRALPNELDSNGNETPNTEMLVASRLVKDIRNRELDNYAWATARCVRCDMGYPFDYSLDDDGFRAKFVEGVIGPLKDDYDEIFSK